MLQKSFKQAKCKTALNLAKSRIKLLKNKKEMKVKQLKRELAQLLESGQDETARIRVEHVVREEKTMTAYELIEIYCELIVARLPIIESQKNCPPDLKEAITSLIFAAPRCGDIPELQDVCKHFTAKYGKEFVAAAIELRPACGVSRTMVEKLSVKAPDGPTKVKILTDIAAQHSVKWEPKWFKDEDEVPSVDIPDRSKDFVRCTFPRPPLVGLHWKVQRTERANIIQMEPLNFEISDDIQPPRSHDDARSATSPQIHAPSANSRTDTRPSGISSEWILVNSQSSETAENAFPTGKQNWNMEFKDANELGNLKEGAEVRVSKEDYIESGVQERESSHSYPVHEEMRKQSRDSFSTMCTSQSESNFFESSNQEEYGNEPLENPFHEETVDMGNLRSIFQSQSSAFGDQYGIFSNVNDPNKMNDSDSGYFGKFNKGSANDGWHFRDAYHSGTFDVKEDTSYKDEQKHGFDSGKDSFVRMDSRNKEKDVEEMSTLVFDESGSDDDECIFNDVHKSYDIPSHSRFLLHKENSPGYSGSQSPFSSHPHNTLDVSEIAFDSDGESSGSEKELQNEKTNPVIHTNLIVSSTEPQKSPQSSDFVSDFQYETQSGPEGGMELNLGLFPGGRRNGPHPHTLDTRVACGDDSSSSRSSMEAVDDAYSHQTSDDPEVITVEKVANTAEKPYKETIQENVYKINPKGASVAEKLENLPEGSEISRASNSNEKGAPSRENSTKKPTHVHPKLPDFESLTAEFQSLRTSR